MSDSISRDWLMANCSSFDNEKSQWIFPGNIRVVEFDLAFYVIGARREKIPVTTVRDLLRVTYQLGQGMSHSGRVITEDFLDTVFQRLPMQFNDGIQWQVGAVSIRQVVNKGVVSHYEVFLGKYSGFTKSGIETTRELMKAIHDVARLFEVQEWREKHRETVRRFQDQIAVFGTFDDDDDE